MLLKDPKAKDLVVRGERSATLENCEASRLLRIVRLTIFADVELAAAIVKLI
jgi:hypothetical protein